MADSQRDVKNRIASVQNIRKITRAMEMVAAARLRRAEQRIEALRPYAGAIRRMTRQAAEAGGNIAGLPILQEREMWRIAQEALVNVERHANARRVEVRWRCDGRSAALEVVDDGDGFPPGKAGRLDSYGMIGMRERASSIGATLDVISAPGKGTAVRCVLTAAAVA